ncbi:hypothetical protein [Lacipirellula sp.]|uniref:hypothetical protein n=1 Tax=Lacipirellula sp. TaxID=2691419 RepID=UPI003D0F29D4
MHKANIKVNRFGDSGVLTIALLKTYYSQTIPSQQLALAASAYTHRFLRNFGALAGAPVAHRSQFAMRRLNSELNFLKDN